MLSCASKAKKDKINKTGVVYHIKCKTCKTDDIYLLGETARQIKDKLAKHRHPSMSEMSPMANHLNYNKHKLNEKDYKIVDKDNNWRKRGIRESIHIRRYNPRLNRDEGRHRLSHAWDDVITLLVTHDTSVEFHKDPAQYEPLG